MSEFTEMEHSIALVVCNILNDKIRQGVILNNMHVGTEIRNLVAYIESRGSSAGTDGANVYQKMIDIYNVRVS